MKWLIFRERLRSLFLKIEVGVGKRLTNICNQHVAAFAPGPEIARDQGRSNEGFSAADRNESAGRKKQFFISFTLTKSAILKRT